MDEDELFHYTLDDLELRLRPEANEYDLLMAAALLRKLLIDSPGLVDRVNRERRMRLRFPIPDPIDYKGRVWFYGTPSADRQIEPWRYRPVSRAEFLAAEVLMAPAYTVSVKRLVRYLANKAGGVHSGPPEEADRDLARLEAGTRLGGLPPGRLALVEIGRVVVHALRPLRDRAMREGGYAWELSDRGGTNA